LASAPKSTDRGVWRGAHPVLARYAVPRAPLMHPRARQRRELHPPTVTSSGRVGDGGGRAGGGRRSSPKQWWRPPPPRWRLLLPRAPERPRSAARRRWEGGMSPAPQRIAAGSF
jgi:hypothetical protein